MNDATPGISRESVDNSLEDVNALLKKLHDFNDNIRMEAASKLFRYPDPKVIKALKVRLMDRCLQVRCHAIDSLVEINDLSVGPSIRARLTDGVPVVRAKAAEALGILGCNDDITADALVNAVDDIDLVSQQAGIALGKLANMKSMEKLFNRLDGKSLYKNRCVALARYGNSIIEPLFKTANYHYYLSTDKHKSQTDRQSAASEIITYYKNRAMALLFLQSQSFDEITRFYDPKSEIKFREYSYYNVDHGGNWEGLLIWYGYNPMNFLVTRYLFEVDDDRILPWLRKILVEDQAPIIRWLILEKYSTLTNYGDDDVKAILSILDKDFLVIKVKAAKALSSMKAKLAVERLCSTITIVDEVEVVCAILHSLGEIGDTRAIPTLIDELINNDRNRIYRQFAAEALGKISSPEGIEALISALGSDGDPDVRKIAAVSLGHLHTQQAKRPLEIVAGRSDEEWVVINAAKSALDEIK